MFRAGLAWIATAALLGAAGMPAAPAHADVVDDAPAAVSPSPGVLDLFSTGGDGQALERVFGASGWSEWSSLGGGLTSGPAVVAHGSTVDLLARGSAGTLVWRSRTDGNWSGWTDLGGGVASAPSAAERRGVGVVDVALRGPGNAVWFRTWTAAAGWSGFASLGGVTLSAPSVVSYLPGYVHVFARSTSNTVDAIWWNGSAWSAWASIGGVATSGPSAVSDADNRIDVFVRGPDAAIYRNAWTGSAWTGWSQIDPAPVSSGPAAVVLGPGRIAVFARMGAEIGMNLLSDGAWTGFKPVQVTPPPPPVPPPSTCGHSVAKVESTLRGKRRRTVGYGQPATITGQALGADRRPVAGAVVHVLDLRAGTEIGRATAGANGRFRFTVPPGTSRTLRAGFQWGDEGFFACGMSLTLKVRAGVRPQASRHVRVRGRIRLSGNLLGDHIPRRGKLVELQGWARGAWQLLRQVRTDRAGRFRATYRLRTRSRGTLRIRARTRAERGYPYTLGWSRVVRVRVG